MTDHDAIAAMVRHSLTRRHASGYSEDVQRAYLDIYDEVMRLRADRKQGGLDYCDLMERHDAHFVAWQSAKSRAEKAEAERDALWAAGDRLSVCAQTTGGTAGRDDGLVDAITGWKEARQALKGHNQ